MLTDVFESCQTEAEFKTKADVITEAIKTGELKLDDLSLRDIAEATLGADGVRSLQRTNEESAFVAVKESVAPVRLSAFTNITGQLVYQGVYEAYSAPEFIAGNYVTNETSREDNTRVPSISEIDADALEVEEGGEFPNVKYGEDYIDIPKSKKRGLKIGITREMVFFDRTNQAIEMARSVGDVLGQNKEKRQWRVILGIDDTYVRKGVARQTYVASGDPRVNQIATALTDWTSIDAAMQAFEAMSNDGTEDKGKRPITVTPKVMFTTAAKIATARHIMNATEVRITNGSNQTLGINPISTIATATSPWIKRLLVNGGVDATAANGYWYIGDPKRAFRYRTLFPMQVLAAQHDKDQFERDVVAQYRADERGVAYVYAPWYMIRSIPG